MKVANHILVGATQQIIAGGDAMPIRRCMVIHYTEGASAQSSVDYWNEAQSRRKDLGAHLVIDRDGTVIQCRAFNRTISHAGASRWQDPTTGKSYTGLNSISIGIELANAGNNAAVIASARQHKCGVVGTARAVHRNGGNEYEWEVYPNAQLEACFNVAKLLVETYRLDDVTGHDCIAPGRKIDPGPLFPMADLRKHCGFKGLPVVHRLP